MKRTFTSVSVGDHVKARTRYGVRLEDEVDSEPGTTESRQRLHAMLQDLVDQPSLLACGPAYPRSLHMTHDGARWILEATAESEDA